MPSGCCARRRPAGRPRAATAAAPAPVSRGFRPESQAQAHRHGTCHRECGQAARCCGRRTCVGRRSHRRPLRPTRQTALTRHLADCLGQAHGPGGRGVSTRMPLGVAETSSSSHSSPIRARSGRSSPPPRSGRIQPDRSRLLLLMVHAARLTLAEVPLADLSSGTRHFAGRTEGFCGTVEPTARPLKRSGCPAGLEHSESAAWSLFFRLFAFSRTAAMNGFVPGPK
jgi:hypothetical protein